LIIQKKLKVNFSKKHLSQYRYIVKKWVNKPSKRKYLICIKNCDELYTIIINHDYSVCEEIKKAIDIKLS